MPTFSSWLGTWRGIAGFQCLLHTTVCTRNADNNTRCPFVTFSVFPHVWTFEAQPPTAKHEQDPNNVALASRGSACIVRVCVRWLCRTSETSRHPAYAALIRNWPRVRLPSPTVHRSNFINLSEEFSSFFRFDLQYTSILILTSRLFQLAFLPASYCCAVLLALSISNRKVDKLLRKYKGNYAEMFKRLDAKYIRQKSVSWRGDKFGRPS